MASVEERFEAKIDRSGGPDACHPWLGGVGQLGQPCVYIGKNRTMSGRRLAWKLAHGEVPSPRRWVKAICGNHRCLNPSHLRLRAVVDDVARFWEKVDRRGPSECWPWIGYVDATGYGRFSPLGGTRTRQAHRVAWEIANDRLIPTSDVEIVVMHSCDFPRCCNPAHLSLGTDRTNHDDMVRKGRAGWQRARAAKALADQHKGAGTEDR